MSPPHGTEDPPGRLDPKVVIGYVLGALALVACMVIAWLLPTSRTEQLLNILICVFGGVLGWVIGILISPKSKPEAKEFERIGAALFSFVSGFLVAKLGESIDNAIKTGVAFQVQTLGRVLLFTASFCIGALFVFVGRRYWLDV